MQELFLFTFEWAPSVAMTPNTASMAASLCSQSKAVRRAPHRVRPRVHSTLVTATSREYCTTRTHWERGEGGREGEERKGEGTERGRREGEGGEEEERGQGRKEEVKHFSWQSPME